MNSALAGWLQVALLVAALAACYIPLGNYIAKIFTTDKHFSALRAARVKVPMFRRIKLLDELQFVRHPSADVEQPHFLTRK